MPPTSISTPRPWNSCGSPIPRRRNSASAEPRTMSAGRREDTVTDDLRIPARHSGDGREWPRMKPAVAGEPVSPSQLMLSPTARQDGATRLGWQRLRMDDESLHAWLAHAIYSDRSLWQLGRDAWYTSLLLLAFLLPLAIRKDRADHRQRLLGRVLGLINRLSTRLRVAGAYPRDWTRRMCGMCVKRVLLQSLFGHSKSRCP